MQGPRPRVRPAVKAHLSVILGLHRPHQGGRGTTWPGSTWLSSNGYVQGAGYTDVHAGFPALDLLILVSLAAAVLLIYNIRRQGWALPILGVGLWFLVALTAGTIYPAAVQALKVNPAQNTLEHPYIERNIMATRAAMGLKDVKERTLPASSNLTAVALSANSDTLGQHPAVGSASRPRRSTRSCRTPAPTTSSTPWRSTAPGQRPPSPRSSSASARSTTRDLPSTSWVNTTLQYTHGYGMIVSPANSETSNGDPQFAVGNVPPVSTDGLPTITQPSVYFGLDNSGYVVANTKQPEIDYQLTNGIDQETHYKRRRGCPALLLLQAGHVRRPLQRHQPAHLEPDHEQVAPHVRPRRAGEGVQGGAVPRPRRGPLPGSSSTGNIEWVQDAYTATDNYPYAQNADTSAVAVGQRSVEPPRSTTSGTRSRSSSTPTPGR